MKLITAVIRPGKLAEVMNAVTDAGTRDLTATKASGFGQPTARGGAFCLRLRCLDRKFPGLDGPNSRSQSAGAMRP